MIRLVVMMYVRLPLSLRNVENLLAERGIDICHETVRMWWKRFGPMLAGDVRHQPISRMRCRSSLRSTPTSTTTSLERHLIDRQTYKPRRSAALAAWRLIAS